MNTSTPENIQEDIPAPQEEEVYLSAEKDSIEGDKKLATVFSAIDEIILKSVRLGGKCIPVIVVIFIIIATIIIIWVMVTWLSHILLPQDFWWLTKEQIMQIHTYLSGVLNGGSSLALILLFRSYLQSKRNSN